ncbi:MAG: zinc-ribbon family [Frankiaceae bacterium]|jgi:hypothetical protein|nr:zinc-ribbon family [Frankiaceae bacterium]
MFFFFGISPRTVRHGAVQHHCSVHGGTAWHELITRRSYFTLFFVLRIFPVGARHDLLTCTVCGATWQLPRAEAESLAAQARTDVGPAAGRGILNDLLRAWTQTSQPSSGVPRRAQADRLDEPYGGATHDPKQKVQWRPNVR